MLKLNIFGFLFVFVLCLISFLLGWFSAVYILPGNLLQKEVSQRQEEPVSLQAGDQKSSVPAHKITKNKSVPFFEEMKANILLLFDPYQIDAELKKNTYIKKPEPLSLKIDSKNITKKTPLADKKELSHSDRFPLPEEPLPLDINKKKTNMVLEKIQAGYDERNREQLMQILGDQEFFTMEGSFSFLVNVFSDEKQTLKYVKQMKEEYPLWSFLIKAYSDHIRIYLGPFSSKAKALEFKQAVSRPLPFSLDFLEEVSL